ncbi:kinase-like domain-containing protein [Mycena filopes]|nr:kinase-like domain-containing protein [Mycena filopes]
MLPLMALSSLQPTHRLRTQFAIHIVKTSSDPADIAVLKQLRDQLDRTEEIQFISRLPDVDFLLRPTHLVVDNEHRIRGLLFPHNPASSLDLTIQRFHPNAAPLNLSPYAATASHGPSLPSTPISISWSVKLSWLIDVAASATWLHAQSIFWNDLKTGNIVVCRDGHCRLIDYAPGGYTVEWSAPETATNPYRASAAKDVFALGLVMWVVAVEIAWFEREVEYVRPFLVWNEEVPGWFRNIVMSCLDEQPTRRPSARDVYEALIQYSQ